MRAIRGTVTHRVTNVRRTHPTLKRVVKWSAIALVSLFALMLALGFTLQACGYQGADKSLPACQFEDSQHCYWDADTMGNGQGRDVINK